MKKITFRDVLTWFIIVCGFLCAFFGPLCVSVLAEGTPSGTYLEGSGQWVCYDNYNHYGSDYTYWWVNVPVGARFCILRDTSNNFILVVVSETSGLSFQRGQSSSPDTPPSSNISTVSLNSSHTPAGVTFYTPSNFGAPPSVNAVGSASKHHFNIPVNDVSTSLSKYDYTLAYEYTYGSSSSAPGPVINYGDIVASYSTEIAGKGFASVNNRDVIKWEKYDSNGNDISNAKVDIRVHYGNYEGESRNSLLLKTWQDFVDYLGFYELGSFSGSTMEASFSWREIEDTIDNLTLSDFIEPKEFVTNGVWQIYGWYFEVRYTVYDDNNTVVYSSPWKKIYTVTSSGVQNSQNIINTTNYNYDVYNSLQEITNINNDNSVTYKVYDNSVTVNNSNITNSSDDGEGGKKSNFWDFLITIIREGFDLIKTAIKGLVDLVTGLFNIEWDFNINTGIQSVKDRGGIFSEALQIEEDINTALESVQEEEFVLSYDAVIVDGVTLIPSGSIDFNTYFSAVGLSHSELYFYTDGFIYLSLLILVSRKLIAFLRR